MESGTKKINKETRVVR